MSCIPLRDMAYRHIESKILSGEIKAGQRLSELALAQELGISRTPVRTAIHELESEGLLEQVPRYGTIVRKADRRDLTELFDLRLALESFAAEIAAQSISADDLEMLTELCDRMQALISDPEQCRAMVHNGQVVAQFVDADMQFHVCLLRATGNRRLMKSVADSLKLSQCSYHARQPFRIDAITEAWDGHRAVLNAIHQHDGDRARQQMADHLRFSKEQALRIFDRLEADGDLAAAMNWASPRASAPAATPWDIS